MRGSGGGGGGGGGRVGQCGGGTPAARKRGRFKGRGSARRCACLLVREAKQSSRGRWTAIYKGRSRRARRGAVREL